MPHVAIAGWIQPCPYDAPAAQFAFMNYHTTGAMLYQTSSIRDSPLSPYLSSDTPTSFSVSAVLPASTDIPRPGEPPLGPATAFCVVQAYEYPVACIAVEHTVDGTPTVHLIPPGSASSCSAGLPASADQPAILPGAAVVELGKSRVRFGEAVEGAIVASWPRVVPGS